MYQIDFNQPLAVYFIGIGGISISGSGGDSSGGRALRLLD